MRLFKLLFILAGIVLVSGCSFLANSLLYPNRQPLIKNPADYNMEFTDFEFYSPDSVNIKGWQIPGDNNKLIIFTHPMNFTRYGYSIKHQKPFKITKVEVEFLNVVKRLNEAGYNILMIDFRNHGESGKGNNGITGVGINEWQDVVGVMRYIKNHEQYSKMPVAIVANCMGANSSIIAFSKQNKELKNIKCLIAIQPISTDVFVDHFLGSDYKYLHGLIPNIQKKCIKKGGYPFHEMSPEKYIKDLEIPILYVQAINDGWTDINQVNGFYEQTTCEKNLFMIEGDLERFDAYNYFGHTPELMLEFLSKHFD